MDHGVGTFAIRAHRALRLLNLLTRNDLETVRKAETDAREGKRIDVSEGKKYYYDWETYSWETAYALRDAVNIPPLHYAKFNPYIIHNYALLENHRRATLILLALQAYKSERGNYPKTLDDLAGTYFDRVPVDPYSGQPYQYFPEGLKAWMRGPGMDFQLLSSGMVKSFIWSTSPEIIVSQPNSKNFEDRYLIYSERLARLGEKTPYIWSRSIYDILSHGHCFFLP